MKGDNRGEVAESMDSTVSVIQDQMDELKNKIQLRDCDHKTYLEWSLKEREQNESVIMQLREENRRDRISLQDSLRGDLRVIKTAFQDRRKETLALLRHSANEVVTITDQKVCERAKLLNAIKHERVSREKKLEDLKMLLREKQHLTAKGPDQLAAEQNIRRLENGIDKARIKFETGKIIGDQYDVVVRRMKEKIRTYPTVLEELEKTMKENKSELNELTKLLNHAVEARDQARIDFQSFDRHVHAAKRERDKLLNATKADVEKRCEWFKTTAEIKRPGHRFAFADTHAELRAQQEANQALERKKKVLSYEDAFNKLKETTGLTDLSDFVETCGQQQRTKEHLSRQVQRLEQLNKMHTDERDRLLREYKQMKYKGESKLSDGEQRLEMKTEEIAKVNAQRDKVRSSYERQGDLIQKVSCAINSVYDKLSDIHTAAVKIHDIPHDIHGHLNICIKKLTHLFENIGKDTTSTDQVIKLMESNTFHELVEERLPETNIRVVTKSPDVDPLEDYNYDSEDNDEMLTRHDIKTMEQHFLENRSKPKRRKNKKRAV